MSRRTLRSLAVVAVLATSLPALQPAASADDVASVQRVSAATDAETAAALADLEFAGAGSAVIARANGAGPAELSPQVAAAVGGPVLFADAASAPAATMDALSALGVSDVVLMGNASVLGQTVADQMTAAGYSVSRVGSALQAAQVAAGEADLATAYLVASTEPQEQMLGSGAAAANDTVAIEVTPGSLSEAAARFLQGHAVRRAILVGRAGEAPQAAALAEALDAMGIEPVPLFGRDVFETSVALEESSFRDPASAGLSNPGSSAGTLLAASLGATRGAPALLVPAAAPLPSFVEGALSAHANGLAELVVVGSSAEVGDDVVAAAVSATRPIAVMDAGDVETGMLGTAYTVVQGIDPVPFDVEVIGVLEDGIAPGIPMILVQTSGPVIEETGGIAAGFSGSPVYVDVAGVKTLLGAIAYGCFACDQTIGGVTPADAMIDVLSYPNGQSSATFRATAQPQTVTAGSGAGAMELRRLDLPAAIGGLGQERFDRVVADLERTGAAITPYRSGGGGVGPSFAPFDPLFPGHSYAGVLAAGAFDFAGIGTTTFRDGDRSLAFGHPFFFHGRSGLGLSAARVHFVWSDPSNLFGAFKVASVTGAHGIMDQDRLAAVAGTEATFPHVGTIVSSIDNLSTSRSFRFATEAVDHPWFPDVSAITLLTTLDRAFDRIGAGSSTLDWTIEGRDADGDPFSLERGNRYASNYDVTYESIFELWFDLYLIQENPFERVTFDRVDVDSALRDEVLRREVVGIRAHAESFRGWVSQGRLRARPGDVISIRAELRRPRGDTIVRGMTIRIPRRARGIGRLFVRGGGGYFDDFYFFDEPGGGGGPSSLDELLAKLAKQTRNDVLIALLSFEGGGGEPIGYAGPNGIRRRATKQLDEVVYGSDALRVRIIR